MNLTIRRAESTDAEAIARVYAGPKAVWGTLQLPYPSVEVHRRKLAESAESVVQLLACSDGDVVGHLSLITNPQRPRRRHVGSIGMSVRDDHQGKGVGTVLLEAAVDLAFRWLNLTRIELEVYTDNEPALRLYRKFGFVVEGTTIGAAFRDGQFVDCHIMARLLSPPGAATR